MFTKVIRMNTKEILAVKEIELKVLNKGDILKRKLLDFFSIPENANRIVPIITHTDTCSLRVLDWFVTNYAKRHHIVYDVETIDNQREKIDVFRSYKSELKSYSKRNFDPFRRKHGDEIDTEVTLYYVSRDSFGTPNPKKENIKTRIRQLNFFRWAIENGVLDYVKNHIDEIEDDMNKTNACHKKGKKTGDSITVKKHKMKITAARIFTKKFSKITVKFE